MLSEEHIEVSLTDTKKYYYMHKTVNGHAVRAACKFNKSTNKRKLALNEQNLHRRFNRAQVNSVVSKICEFKIMTSSIIDVEINRSGNGFH